MYNLISINGIGFVVDKLIWTEEWSVGEASLDAQHREIILIINRLIEHRYEPVTSEVVSDALTQLTEYVSRHFKSEEQLLEQALYPYLAVQKSEHKEFRVKLVQFCTAASEHVGAVPEALLNWLTEWWYRHILEEDMQYRDYVK